MKKITALHQQKGLTLIELMITIAVLSILLFVGSSFTTQWVDRSQVNSASAQLKNAISQAKVVALRNSNNIALDQVAVSLCVDQTNNVLNLIRYTSSNASLCNTNTPNTVIHRFPIAKGISIKQGDQDLQCLSFNAAGILDLTLGSACSSNPQLNFKVEKNHEAADLFIM